MPEKVKGMLDGRDQTWELMPILSNIFVNLVVTIQELARGKSFGI